MTTGSKTLGQYEAIYDPNYQQVWSRQQNFGSKAWAGPDSPKVGVFVPYLIDNDVIRVKARHGKETITVIHRKKLRHYLHRPVRPTKQEHPYTMSLIRTTDNGCKLLYDSLPNVPYVTGCSQYFSQYQAFEGWTSNDDLALLGKLRSKVGGTSFNAGVFLGEGHEALKLITDSATKLYRGALLLKQGNLIGAARTLSTSIKHPPLTRRKTFGQNWLELQYGWLPLLGDMHEGAEFLAHHFSVPLQEVVRVKRTVKGSYAAINEQRVSPQYSRVTSYGQIKAILREKDVIALSGLKDPFSVLWELTPLSFVFDWGIPIGQYLAARGLAQSLTGTYVTTKFMKSERTGFVDRHPQFGETLSALGPAAETRLTLNRVVSDSLSVPAPSIKPLNKVLGWQHCANALALLSGFKIPER